MANAKNFLEFLSEYDLIQIPRIQRDYVQGGNSKKATDIRETFVGDLCNAIKEQKVLLLDFIYGNVEMIGDKRCFYPLDGQQRLTTLFLLHWYGSLFLDDDEGDKIREILQKFSYQTRFSSEQFCKLLFNKDVIDSAKKCGDGQKISDAIKDDPGYSKFWKYDPTVDSMLNMLDCIQQIARMQGIKWEKDFADTIKFYVYEIKDSQEPDDLYVKMNARGKHLTNFENLKAHLQQWMNNSELDDVFRKSWKEKMDADWSDFFWNAKDEKELQNIPDPAKDFIDKPFWVFLNRIAILGYILNNLHILEMLRKKKSERSKEEEETVKDFSDKIKQMSMESAENYVSPLLQKEIFQNKPEMYKTVAKILDLLSLSQKEREPGPKLGSKQLYPLWVTEKNSFSNFFWDKSGSSRAGRLQILAFAFYCKHFADTEINIEHLQHWMQFYHQICSDLHDEQAEAGAISMILIALRAMKKDNKTDIYNYLAEKYQNKFEAEKGIEPLAKWHFSIKNDNTIYRELFGKNQLDENNQASSVNFQWAAIWNEALKCYLRTQSDDWNTLLCNIEKNSILRGYIQGIISQNDNDDVLYNNANIRFSNFSDEKQKLFSQNHESFVKLLGYVDLKEGQKLELPFYFLAYSNWRENVIITKQDIAEPVCKLLLNPNDSVNVSEMPIWRKTLMDTPQLITEGWEPNCAQTIKSYRGDDKMHLYKKGNIASGTIVLDRSIHTKISKMLEGIDSESMETREIGDKIFYVCKSVDCIIGYGKINDKNRIKFTTQGLVKETREDSYWEYKGEFISWDEITNIEEFKNNFLCS